MTYGRIHRGVMAADHFTQVANGLFRDPRISGLAKALFGLLSTHRDGYGVTVKTLMRDMKEKRDAILRALAELEDHGYLIRERERRDNGTLGGMVYQITDAPAFVPRADIPRSEPESEIPTLALTGDDGAVVPAPAKTEKPRSEPRSGKPTLVEPTLVNPDTKNTNPKNINEKKTNRQAGTDPAAASDPQAVPDRPACLPGDGNKSDKNGANAGRPAEPEGPGAELLRRIPDHLATPQVIRQHHETVAALLAGGWSADGLYRRLIRECDGAARPGRLVTAIREVPPTPPQRAWVIAEAAAPEPVKLGKPVPDSVLAGLDPRFRPTRALSDAEAAAARGRRGHGARRPVA